MDWDKYEEELLDRLGMTIKWFDWLPIEPKSILKKSSLQKPIIWMY
jgi:hypothetical protein